ncbi:MAG: PHP domain-containing protein [Clostridia bacterium]|nr:PHP domain-containing protein [Clostridia bacterium]
MTYKYETHLHTMQGSACGRVPGRDYIAKYIDLGYDGIFVTDHFFHGNCRPSRDLPWEEWVKQYCMGYEDAAEEGYKRGFKVFFGQEVKFPYFDEWLVYGLDKNYLLAHPDMRDWTRKEYLDNVHAAGGCCIQCHPFRQAVYKDHVAPCLGVDCVEICNSGNKPEWDAMAVRYVRKMLPDLFYSAGSDIHHTEDKHGDEVFGVSFDAPLNSVQDYVRAVLLKTPHGLLVPPGRITPIGDDIPLGLPMTVFDRDCQPTALGIVDIF